MKNLVKALSDKKTMYVAYVIITICTMLDVIASYRMGTKLDILPIGVLYSLLAVWGSSFEKKDEKADK